MPSKVTKIKFACKHIEEIKSVAETQKLYDIQCMHRKKLQIPAIVFGQGLSCVWMECTESVKSLRAKIGILVRIAF